MCDHLGERWPLMDFHHVFSTEGNISENISEMCLLNIFRILTWGVIINKSMNKLKKTNGVETYNS